MVKKLMSYLPASSMEAPPRYQPGPPMRSPDELMGLIPADPNKAFDMHSVIECLVDEGSWFELKPLYAPELITGFARIDGQVVGFVANNSAHKAGAIFPESSDKAAHFIWRCDAFNIPLVFLSDTPGFMVGPDMERKAILMRGRKFIYATSSATVPKFCVVVRKAYGAGIYAMCGPAFGPESTLALPGAEIAIMGPEAAINAVYLNKILAVPAGPERDGVRGQAARGVPARHRRACHGRRPGHRPRRAARGASRRALSPAPLLPAQGRAHARQEAREHPMTAKRA